MWHCREGGGSGLLDCKEWRTAASGTHRQFYGGPPMQVLCFGVRREFAYWTASEDQYAANRLTAEQIAADILKSLG